MGVFWDFKGVLHIDFVHECHPVNAARYCMRGSLHICGKDTDIRSEMVIVLHDIASLSQQNIQKVRGMSFDDDTAVDFMHI